MTVAIAFRVIGFFDSKEGPLGPMQPTMFSTTFDVTRALEEAGIKAVVECTDFVTAERTKA